MEDWGHLEGQEYTGRMDLSELLNYLALKTAVAVTGEDWGHLEGQEYTGRMDLSELLNYLALKTAVAVTGATAFGRTLLLAEE